MYTKLGLFQPSYEIVDMALREFQRAALGPYRCHQRIARHHGDHSLDGSSEKLRPVFTMALGLPPTLDVQRSIYLVPWGRYLFTRLDELIL